MKTEEEIRYELKKHEQHDYGTCDLCKSQRIICAAKREILRWCLEPSSSKRSS